MGQGPYNYDAARKATGISATPEPSALRKVLELLTGYPADPTREIGPIEALTASVPLMGAAKAAKGIRAFHGSPHDFDRFDLGKIGTGEGAQAFGHGVYFAENEGVAQSYRDMLSKDRPGRMYEVSIGAEPESLLDWDKPLSQQSDAVQERLRPAVEYLKSRPIQPKALAKLHDGSVKGRELYMWLSGEKAFDEARASWPVMPKNPNELGSRTLREQGVPGIQYLDAGSRPGGVGTRNYVIFDDALIDVLRKWGLMPAAVGAGAAYGATKEQ